MSEMVEKVARALHGAWCERGGLIEEFHVSADSHWFPYARAILAAMREPTEEMLKDGEATIFEDAAEPRDWTVKATFEGWQAMIDAALK